MDFSRECLITNQNKRCMDFASREVLWRREWNFIMHEMHPKSRVLESVWITLRPSSSYIHYYVFVSAVNQCYQCDRETFFIVPVQGSRLGWGLNDAMFAIQGTTAVWKLPPPIEAFCNSWPICSILWCWHHMFTQFIPHSLTNFQDNFLNSGDAHSEANCNWMEWITCGHKSGKKGGKNWVDVMVTSIYTNGITCSTAGGFHSISSAGCKRKFLLLWKKQNFWGKMQPKPKLEGDIGLMKLPVELVPLL